jgi:hypothetical protein
MSWRFGIPEGCDYPATMAGNERRQVFYTVSFRSEPGIKEARIKEAILWLVSLKWPAMRMRTPSKS